MQSRKKTDNKIALVIGWGSVKCAAAMGLMRVLKREGIEVNMLVAGGGGSIYAALMALGYDVDEIIAINQRLWTREVTSNPNRRAIFQILLPRIFKTREYFNLLDDALVNERLKKAFGDKTFADVKIPLYITATEYKTGKQIVLSQGSLFEAVRASISLPLIFPPFLKGETLLSDGYLSDPLPIGVAMQEGADIILALGFEAVSDVSIDSFKDYLLHLASILSNNLQQASTAFYNLAHHREVISIVPHFEGAINLFDVHKVPVIIKAGEAEAENHLAEIRIAMEEA
jgi:NTE family protein